MTAHTNVLIDSRTFKYFFIVLIMCPNYSLDGLLMTIDDFTMYTVYNVFYVYYLILFQSRTNYQWRLTKINNLKYFFQFILQ
jgi:hypothetical protein